MSDKGPLIEPPSEVVRLRRLLHTAVWRAYREGWHEPDCDSLTLHGISTDCDCWMSLAFKELGIEL